MKCKEWRQSWYDELYRNRKPWSPIWRNWAVWFAFSGGVDSTYLMHEARKVLGDRAMAVTMNPASVPEREVADAIEYCKKEGILQKVVKMDQFGIDGFAENPSNRCYLCKHFLSVPRKWQRKKALPMSSMEREHTMRPSNGRD